MNCKPGDLAMYVGRDQKCRGWVVLVVAQYRGYPGWVVDPPMPSESRPGKFADAVADSALRPIRPSEGEDETLQWAPITEPA